MVLARPRIRSSLVLLAGIAGILFAGCGSGGDKSIDTAGEVSAREFPAAGGRTLRQIASSVQAGPQVGLATSVLLPGSPQRLAFGVIDAEGKFIYAKTALYVARRPGQPARGPYPAPIDSMRVRPAFVSKTSALDKTSIRAIYAAQVPFPKAGRYAVLAVSKTSSGLIGAATSVDVQRSSPIPAVGQTPPKVHTDTVTSASGNLNAIDTRNPHDDMHKVDFASVIGKRPVALLFSTPQLCQSRVCGPVTDIAVALEQKYGKQMTFIHEEVYVANDIKKGLRPQLRAFNLQSEPWLFTFDRQGRVAARLEGSFGVNAFTQAVQAALR